MSSSISKLLSLVFLLSTVSAASLHAEGSPDPTPVTRELHRQRYISFWDKLIPHYFKTQFAGGMGFLSIGSGWDYGKRRQWETDVFLGFVPQFSGNRSSATFTLKQNYIPWKIPLNKRFGVEPLTTGIYLNKLFADNFWTREPHKYGGSYYKFTTAVRLHAFVGQRLWINMNEKRRMDSIVLFYEVSTNDLYLMSAFNNHNIKPHQIMVLSFGVKLQFL